ncbi:cytochrome c maturation protein CcmE [endosymbiont of unidentified scaly snail isolate Monju]|uniref:cytochrome c maturation protein CcmE n=1 Tax=endosymbiont of unidentified scaly snail isolate Monju TaxID=1248727 RepID=UPI0003892CB1|nr:cytochrome c maturation protein CcmE [endosymbiont of unidentified scaly snail isolate Monju]BAN68318.1 cytochrome c-type biogenesis protein CcmE [endosymbiont of unidentified scaly snail isolate Monju]
MKARHKRLILVAAGLAILALATSLVLNALEGNLSYFFSPTEVAEGKAPADHVFRLGGMVEKGSVQRAEGDLTVHFVVTDFHKKIPVAYQGILPDLFAEGQGVIAQGKLNADGVFVADEVLAKHDENYMPPEVAAAMKAGEKARMQTTATGN